METVDVSRLSANNTLVALSIREDGDFTRVLNAIKARKTVEDEYIDQAIECIGKSVAYLDERYPQTIKDAVPQPPFAIFFEDNAIDLSGDKFAFIMRTTSDYAKPIRERIIKCLPKQGYTVVWLREKTANWIDGIRPNGERFSFTTKRSAVPSNTLAVHLKQIASGMSERSYVLDCKPRSSNLLGVAFALHCGRDVYALPHQITDDDICNTLIAEGACPISLEELQ